jgi:hypothetical protein
MVNIYTNSKVNPITGTVTDNNPRQEARQAKRQVKKADRALNKSLNEGIKKQGPGLKRAYKGTSVEKTSSSPKAKDWRDRSKVGALLHGTPVPHKDKGGKKSKSMESGKGGRVNWKNVDDSCKAPK